MKNIIKIYLVAFMFIAAPVFAVEGMAVIDMRTAVLSTQAAADAFKALEEDADYSSNLELCLSKKLHKCKKIFKIKAKT